MPLLVARLLCGSLKEDIQYLRGECEVESAW